MNRKFHKLAIAVFLMAAVFLLPSVTSHASLSEQSIYLTKTRFGSRYYWIDNSGLRSSTSKRGKGKLIVAQPNLQLSAVSDGRFIYYSLYGRRYTTLYRCTMQGRNVRKLKQLKGARNMLTGYYKGQLFYSNVPRGKNSRSAAYLYNIKSRKTKKISSDLFFFFSYKKYYLGYSVISSTTNDSVLMALKLYNASNQELQTLSKSCLNFTMRKDIIYMVEYISSKSDEEHLFKLRQYNCSSGTFTDISDRTFITSELMVGPLTDKYVIYLKGDYAYKYYYRTGKTIRLKDF